MRFTRLSGRYTQIIGSHLEGHHQALHIETCISKPAKEALPLAAFRNKLLIFGLKGFRGVDALCLNSPC